MLRYVPRLLILWAFPSICLAQPLQIATIPGSEQREGSVQLASPPPEPCAEVLPINLPTALHLAGSRPIDVQLAAERIRGALAALDLARAAWLPTVTIGGDYNRHDGPIQNADGTVSNASRGSWMFGLGSGILNGAVFSLTDAIFSPLAAKQTLAAREADLEAANNNTMVAVTDAYFAVEQARGELAGAVDATRKAEDLVRRVRKLAEGVVPPLEIPRAEAELERRRETELLARERWQVASADLARILRLDVRTAEVQPLEPPHLQIFLIDLKKGVEDLVAVALTHRPELASNQAQVQAALTLLRQEKYRPLIPYVLLRGWSTPVTGTLGATFFGGGTNGNLSNTGLREDFDVQLLWQLDNLGFGNVARARQRASDHRVAILELLRTQDRVTAEVVQAHAQAVQAARRVEVGERMVKQALDSYEKNLTALGQTRRAGELVLTVARPQEVLQAVQALAQSYASYYTAIADSNRAQFRLYRALGQPAQLLAGDGSNLPCCEAVPSPGPAAGPPIQTP